MKLEVDIVNGICRVKKWHGSGNINKIQPLPTNTEHSKKYVKALWSLFA